MKCEEMKIWNNKDNRTRKCSKRDIFIYVKILQILKEKKIAFRCAILLKVHWRKIQNNKYSSIYLSLIVRNAFKLLFISWSWQEKKV